MSSRRNRWVQPFACLWLLTLVFVVACPGWSQSGLSETNDGEMESEAEITSGAPTTDEALMTDRAYSFLDVAFDLYLKGELEGAFDSYSSALPLLLPLLENGSDSNYIIASLYAAGIAARRGKGDVASTIATEALNQAARYEAVLSRKLTPESKLVYYINASNLLSGLGRYPECVQFAEKGCALAEALGDREAEARSYNNLAMGYRFQGKHQLALDYYHRALAVNRALGDAESRSLNWNNIGFVLFLSGDYNQAMEAYQLAIAIAEAHDELPWASPQRTVALTNLAAVLEKISEGRRALDLYLDLLKNDGLLDVHRVQILSSLGRVYRVLGAPRRALAVLEKADELSDSQGDPGSTSNVLMAKGHVLCAGLSRHREAQDAFVGALELSTRIRDRNEEIFNHYYLGQCFLHTEQTEGAGDHFARALAIALETDSKEGQWLAFYGLARAKEALGLDQDALRHVDSSLKILETVRKENIGEPARAGFFEDKQEIYALAVRLTRSLKTGSTPSDRVAAAFEVTERSKSRALLDRLGMGPLSPKAIQAELASDEAIVEFLISERDSVAFVVTGETILTVSLPSVDLLKQWVTLVRSHLFHSKESQGDWSRGQEALGRVSKEVVFPILAALSEGVRSLILVLDGPLTYLPFGAVPCGPQVGSSLLMERYVLSTAPSASALVGLRRRPRNEEYGIELAAFGSPSLPYHDRSKKLSSLDLIIERMGLGPLVHSAEEVRLILKHIPAPHVLRIGDSATYAELSGVSQMNPRILHLATHTVIDEESEAASAILLSPDQEDHDGQVRVKDLQKLTFSAELVTLSSCESALGRAMRGEGILGPARAFLESGARAVLCTQCPVRDDRSSVIMDQFYFFLGKGLSPASALREAQLALLGNESTSDPSFWAPYILVGDAGTPLYPRSTRFRVVAAVVVGMLTLLLGILVTEWVRRSRRSLIPPRLVLLRRRDYA